jgi:hypothetical protein
MERRRNHRPNAGEMFGEDLVVATKQQASHLAEQQTAAPLSGSVDALVPTFPIEMPRQMGIASDFL